MTTAILFDTETTGLMKPSANSLKEQPHMTEIFAYKVDSNIQIIDQFHSMIRPPIPVPEEITRLTRINDQMLASAPPFRKVYPLLAEFFLGSTILVAQNAPFDVSILEVELRRLDKLTQFPWPPMHICTAEYSTAINGSRMSLKKLHTHITGEEVKGHHRAQNDVDALLTVFRWLCEEGIIK
jgi:DNA polymerase III epsilon subunit-like protein